MNKKERNIAKLTLIPSYYSGSQISMSIGKNKAYKKALYNVVKTLFKKIDKGSIKNKDIRRDIRILKERSKVSIGQAQKVINVCLKYYTILSNKDNKILKELDCPLDSTIFREYGDHKIGLNKTTKLQDLERLDNYDKWQEHLKKKGNGIRIRADLIYDRNRMKKFLK